MDAPHLPEDSDDVTSTEGTSTAVENDKPQSQSTNFRDWQQAYEDTRGELKSMDRDIRDQSLEIRDLKRQNAQLNERNGDLREKYNQLREVQRARPEKLLKSEKSKYIEHFEILEEHINHLQYERQKRDAHMESLTTQTREANEEKASLEVANRRLQRQVKELSDNLTECKDDLLRLQPTSQVSENEISDQYANLDQQISGWVDDRTEDAQVLEEQIDKIKSVDDLPQLFKQYMSSDRLKLAKKFPESQPLLLRYLIHCCLGTFVLGNDIYLFGLDSRNIALLQGIEVGMKSLEPRRGKYLPHLSHKTPRSLSDHCQMQQLSDIGGPRLFEDSSEWKASPKSKNAKHSWYPKRCRRLSHLWCPSPSEVGRKSTSRSFYLPLNFRRNCDYQPQTTYSRLDDS